MKHTEKNEKNWHQQHVEKMSFGQHLSDIFANTMGSWKFIIWQTLIVLVWMTLNVVGYVQSWDPYPFILLNLLFSTQAAYAAPIIMMSQNRQAERDRVNAEEDFRVNREAKEEIEDLQRRLTQIETEKLDTILRLLQEKK